MLRELGGRLPGRNDHCGLWAAVQCRYAHRMMKAPGWFTSDRQLHVKHRRLQP